MKKTPLLASALSILLSQAHGSADEKDTLYYVPDTVLSFVKERCDQIYDSFSGKLPPKKIMQITKVQLEKSVPFGIWDCKIKNKSHKIFIAADSENISLQIGDFIQNETGKISIRDKGKMREPFKGEVKAYRKFIEDLLQG